MSSRPECEGCGERTCYSSCSAAEKLRKEREARNDAYRAAQEARTDWTLEELLGALQVDMYRAGRNAILKRLRELVERGHAAETAEAAATKDERKMYLVRFRAVGYGHAYVRAESLEGAKVLAEASDMLEDEQLDEWEYDEIKEVTEV